MKCVICRQGTLAPGRAVITLTRGAMTLVIKNVPADVCDTCGEEYAEESITSALLRMADEAERAGVQVDVREYVAA